MSSSLTPDERDRSDRARYAALIGSAKRDPREMTAKARANNPSSIEWHLRKVPADLPEAERRRRAEALRKAYFVDLARKSAKARAKGTDRG